jgi:hypothetical protein
MTRPRCDPNRHLSTPFGLSSRLGLGSATRRIGGVSVVSRAPVPTASGRSPEQRLRALAKANEVRVARAQLKREVASGRILPARVVADPPTCAQTAKVRELLLVVPRIGTARADRVLARCRIAHAKTLDGLSDRQRTELAELLAPLTIPRSRRPQCV